MAGSSGKAKGGPSARHTLSLVKTKSLAVLIQNVPAPADGAKDDSVGRNGAHILLMRRAFRLNVQQPSHEWPVAVSSLKHDATGLC